MKKSVFRFLMTVATVAAVGFAVGCSNGTTDDNGGGGSSGGVLTVTGIPDEFNGQWAGANVYYDSKLVAMGVQSVDKNGDAVLPVIKDGKVSLPLWELDKNDNIKRWTGNITPAAVQFAIWKVGSGNIFGDDTSNVVQAGMVDYLTFKDGNVTVDYADIKVN